VERLQAFKYALMPSPDQQRDMRRFCGSCRFVFNKALALQKERYARGETKLGYAGLCKQLTVWRHSAETPWLKDAPVHALQQALKNLDRAYAHFFAKRAGFPRFKRKGQSEGFRYPDPKQFRLDQANGRIWLPKLGWIRYRNSRPMLGEPRNVTVSLAGGRWFVSIRTRRDVEPPIPKGGAIGIDMGVTRFATLSDGRSIEPLNSFRRHEARLRRYQRAMSRKCRFSNNWKKAKARLQRIHERIANARRDFLHKASTTISQNHAIVCIEDLRWFEFRRQLDYKLAWKGGRLVAVPPQNTSRECPACTHVAADNRLSQAHFECVKCGFKENADVVGAINVLARGHRVLACGEPVQQGRSMKQEPTEAVTREPALA
jgi:putative transposase